MTKDTNQSPILATPTDRAKPDNDMVLVAEGDWGGQIYFSVDLDLVNATDADLERLLIDIDKREWGCNDGEGTCLYKTSKRKLLSERDSHILGGMGGLAYTPGVLNANIAMGDAELIQRLGLLDTIAVNRPEE